MASISFTVVEKLLVEFLKSLGFENTCSDPALYVHVKNDMEVMILVYVDDLIIIRCEEDRMP